MKKLLFSFLIVCFALPSFAKHIMGGEMYYYYLGPGTAPNSIKYQVVLKLYRDLSDPTGAALDPTVNFGVYKNIDNSQYSVVSNLPLDGPYPIDYTSNDACFGQQNLRFEIGYYRTTIELPVDSKGYTIAFQRCCRRAGIDNLLGSDQQGATYFATIPGTNVLGSGPQNTSPRFANRDSAIVCDNHTFSLDFSAVDDDGDSLVYYFCSGYTGGGMAQTTACDAIIPNPPCAPPYTQLSYNAPFSGASPLGPTAFINSHTGIVSGISPNAGSYVVSVCVDEYRNGIKFNTHKKEFLLTVKNCNIPTAKPPIDFTTCDGYTVNFTQSSTGNITSYFWNFGVGSTLADTSTLPNPTFTFPDTGVYHVMLAVNRESNCSDTGYTTVKVYPGFFPGFKWTGFCSGRPVQFTDTTKTNYGFVNSRRWDFGNPATLADTSHLASPLYVYPAAGTYNVTFIVSNSKGCIDTLTNAVPIIDNPTLATLFKDTSYCGKDTIQLHSSSTYTGTFSWVPAVNMIGANTADPFVFPSITTTYHVILNASGCIGTDSVIVRPQLDLATNVNATPQNICEEDTLTLTATANHSPVQFLWSPAATVLSSTSAVTKAFPKINTTYSVSALWGNHCVATNNKAVTVKPLAVPNAGPDAAFCPRTNGVPLSASGGDNYNWRPSTGLSASNIPNPQATPDTTTLYIVSVGVTGCSKRREDSVLITVRPLPPLAITHDTLMCAVVDTMQLNATGTGSIFWTPNYIINNQNSASPLVSPRVTTKYYATLTDALGCKNIDSVIVRVKDSVTLSAGNDTSICRTDAVTLKPVSDALHYLWTPGQPILNSDTAKYPIATPLNTTTFHLIGNIGKCQSQAFVTVKVAPYPVANASGDTTICYGDVAQLFATGGSIYSWSPTFFLNNPRIYNPVSNTNRIIRYVVSITDTLGCPKAVTDTVVVKVYPKIIADAGPPDTIVVINQPLQLQATGGQSYLWSPSAHLSNPNIPNPVAVFGSVSDAPIKYYVTATTGNCSATDSIIVYVYKINPGLYVPNAFTPNGDGINDVFRPIPIGMKRIIYFEVFNRWGQLVFETSEQMKGWDGTFKGKPQDAAAYVWIVEGLDYQGNTIRQKGSVVLIR